MATVVEPEGEIAVVVVVVSVVVCSAVCSTVVVGLGRASISVARSVVSKAVVSTSTRKQSPLSQLWAVHIKSKLTLWFRVKKLDHAKHTVISTRVGLEGQTKTHEPIVADAISHPPQKPGTVISLAVEAAFTVAIVAIEPK